MREIEWRAMTTWAQSSIPQHSNQIAQERKKGGEPKEMNKS